MYGVEYTVKPRETTVGHIFRREENDVKILIEGKDPEQRSRIAARYAEVITRVPGVVDVRRSLQDGTREYLVSIDRDKADRYGLTVNAIAQHIAEQVRGKEATNLTEFDRRIPVRVQPAADLRKAMPDLLSSSMYTREGREVPLRDVVHWESRVGPAEIRREHQQRVSVITANVSGRSIGAVVHELEHAAALINVPAGYSVSVGGEREEIQESLTSLLIVVVLALLLVYMILASEYESVLYPLVILLTSPLAFVGAIFAMIVTGENYNLMSLVGIVIMIGAVDNDAVIVVDVMTELKRQGLDLPEAIRRGIRQRLRPIVMTTSTTVLGVVPLLFGSGAGSTLLRTLTTPLVGGLIASTVFTIVTIPAVYASLDRWTKK
jgi:HAE1 family hydrophobic/amphiphilic exporter-1